MRDIETIIREMNLPAHFKKHPPVVNRHLITSVGLRALTMNGVCVRELDALHGAVAAKGYIGFGAFEPGSNEERVFGETVNALWLDMERLADRTLDEGRMKPAKLYALQDDETKTVFEVWKTLHDLEQGDRNEQRGLSAKINKLTKERDEWKAKCAKLEDALRAAQTALAEKIAKN